MTNVHRLTTEGQLRVLLHTCCGPCACACAPRLQEEGHDVTLFFSNCNIDTREEFVRRLEAARKLGDADGVDVVADDYDHAAWLEQVAAGFEDAPEKGARCTRCFRFSLARTAAYAAAHGYDAFTTSLTVSPHKVSPVVFAAGVDAAGNESKFLEVDFKKKDGFLRSLKRSAELDLYRQSYCGCEFSKHPQPKDAP